MTLDLLALLLLATPAPPAATRTLQAQDGRPTSAEQDDADAETKPFRIPDHGAAKSRMARADEHLAAGRYAEAITELQALLEEHRGDLLGGERPPAIGRATSKQPVYPGAARRARERLVRLPDAARELYRQRFERDASSALDRARARGDRGALAEIARRWPLTHAAEQAWWALGDLEHERGEEDKALAAWGRALADRLGDPEIDFSGAVAGRSAADAWSKVEARLATSGGNTDGVRQRIAIARGEAASAPASAANPGFASALDPGPPGPLPSLSDLGQESWPDGVELPPHPSPMNSIDELFPARAADVVLVSTTLRLFALHAWSGSLLWDSGEPAGWDALGDRERNTYFDGIDKPEALIAPAASGRVALAALQIPVSFVGSFHYSANVPVTTIIPDRRLFAFDLETGARLWSHEPPPGWDGEGGSFAQRMSVAGPPIVVGGRVLAPFYRLQGRIDYHVGCFDLETGALIWSTALISGQRELNMFGRPEFEFSAPPVVVVGDKVVALTQLGAVAALDIFTGELLWETLYDQLPLPKNLNIALHAPRREAKWHNSPPAVAEGVVIAAPFDGFDLFGLDLATGAMLWNLPQRTIQERTGGFADRKSLLVGARRGCVFVFGRTLAALRAPLGLALSAPEATGGWNFADDRFEQESKAVRPVLAGDRIFVPFRDDLLEIDVESGRRVASHAWAAPGLGGNVVVGPGEVTTLSRSSSPAHISATFDWEILTQRARAEVAAHPADPGLVLTLGRLLADRGASEWQRGQAGPARTHIDEAEAVLSGMIAARGPESATSGKGAAARVEGDTSLAGAELHRVLRAKARLRAGLADRAGALAALKKARAIAPDAGALRDTLLEELALLRSSEPAGAPHGAAYLDAEAELERSCGELPILCDVLPAVESQDARAAALGAGPSGLPRFTPLVGGTARRDAAPWEVPAGLWVLLDRTASAEDDGDARAQFESLHAILERHGSVELPGGTAASLSADRIGTLLREGRTEGYETFEARARALFDEASGAHDAAALARVGRLYPHSKAADDADDRRLAWAMEAGEAGSVAEIVQAMIPRGPSLSIAMASAGSSGPANPGPAGSGPASSGPTGWRLATATEREVRALLRLSSVFARAGSRELSAALLRRLGQVRPEIRSDLDGDGGRTLAELSAGIPRWRATDPDADIGSFHALKKEVRIPLTGEWEILGRLLPEESASRDPDHPSGDANPGTPKDTHPAPAGAGDGRRAPAGEERRAPAGDGRRAPASEGRRTPAGDARPEPGADARGAPDLGSNPCAVIGVAPYRNSKVLVNAVIQTDPSAGPDLAFSSSVTLPIPQRSFGATTPPLERCGAVVAGRILVATESGVSAVDEHGDMAWAWSSKGPPPISITVACAAGVAVVSIDHGAGKRSLVALDARSGLELWQTPITDPGLSLQPALSAERIVLLPSGGRRRALVLDLFTGRETVAFLLDTAAAASTNEDAWIQDELLIVPWFLESRTPSRNQVVAYDLSTGARAWRIAIGEDRPSAAPAPAAPADTSGTGSVVERPLDEAGSDAPRDREPDSRELAGVLQCGDRSWLLVRPSGMTNDKTATPSILELAPRIGALSPLPGVRISPTDRLVGLAVPRRYTLPKNVILLIGGTAEARLRAVDLDHGEQWAQTLQGVSIGFLEQGRMQPPLTAVPPAAFSGDAIAIAYSLSSGQSVGMPTNVETFDAKDGRSLSSSPLRLAHDMGRSDEIRFHPLGDGLLVRGRSGLEVLR